MARKGFTLVELLVVIAVIALLMGILMPALSRARQLAYRVVCGANLSGVGKAMLVYANDYDDKLPRGGGPSSVWGPITDWLAEDRYRACGLDAGGEGGQASISSCFYLLIKYVEVTSKSFICKGDDGAGEFRWSRMTGIPANVEMTDAWDFGPAEESFKHCSYSYHIPFGRYALRTQDEPGLAVAADRNPWLASPAADPAVFARFLPHMAPWNASDENVRAGNAIAHQSDGQNVLSLDGHVLFERRSYCALGDDNIYTISDRSTGGSPLGTVPPMSKFDAANRRDSVLVHDPAQWQSRTSPT
jgi:prepilin-type N-terminal cleavage/methylation domain-containing protein